MCRNEARVLARRSQQIGCLFCLAQSACAIVSFAILNSRIRPSLWIGSVDWAPPRKYGTHSLRRTNAALIYNQTGNIRAVQFQHSYRKIESTVRHLGVDVEDALALVEGTEVRPFIGAHTQIGRRQRP